MAKNSAPKSIEVQSGIKQKQLELLKAKIIVRLDEIDRQKHSINKFLSDADRFQHSVRVLRI